MTIIGNFVKSAITVRKEFQSWNDTPPVEVQRKQLKNLLERASGTAFGIYYGFDNILQAEDFVAAFQQKVPLHEYEQMHDRWWRQQQIEENITWPGKPDYFALSASTTGDESKRIPVTKDMLQSIRSVGFQQFVSLSNFDLPADFFEKDMLMLGSSAQLKRRKDHLEGEISGISANNLPGWFDNFYKPGLEIASIPKWDDRVLAIAKKAPEWDVGGISGIPSWMQLMLREVIDYHNLDSIHDIWPNLQVFTTGGVAFDPYRNSFEEIFAKPVHILDTYLASEGFIAFTARPGTMNMRLAVDANVFYEFVPFDKRGFDKLGNLRQQPEVLTLEQVEEGQDYALLLSSPAGAWRYMIGDTIKFTDLERLEIKITGRTKFWLNVTSEQLAEDKMNEAIEELSDQLGAKIDEFTVSALEIGDGVYKHQWILGSNDDFAESDAKSQLDKILQRKNKAYRVARSKALKEMEVKRISKDRFYEWLAADQGKGGQLKTPKVLEADRMRSFLADLS